MDVDAALDDFYSEITGSTEQDLEKASEPSTTDTTSANITRKYSPFF